MSHKVYKSGSCKRKYKKLQDEATKAVLAKTPKLVHFLAKADTDSHELTETTTTRDIDARDVIADADPNNHSSSNTEVHIAPDPEKTR